MNDSKPKRPLSLILFAVWIAVLGGVSLTWSIVGLKQSQMLTELGVPTSRLVIGLGFVWSAGLLAGAVGLWLRREPARWAALFLVPAYYLTRWLDWLLTSRASYAQSRIEPYTILSLLVIAYSTWFLTRRRTRQQFKR